MTSQCGWVITDLNDRSKEWTEETHSWPPVESDFAGTYSRFNWRIYKLTLQLRAEESGLFPDQNWDPSALRAFHPFPLERYTVSQLSCYFIGTHAEEPTGSEFPKATEQGTGGQQLHFGFLYFNIQYFNIHFVRQMYIVHWYECHCGTVKTVIQGSDPEMKR